MGSPTIFAGQRTKLLTSKGLLLKDGTTIDNDGVPNFIRNYCGAIGTTGWVEGSYTAASRPSGNFTASSGAGAFAISTTSTTPLGTGTTSFLLTKSAGASRQGRAVETSFALPLSYRAKVLQLNIDYIINSGTFVAGSNSAYSSLIWYCAFSTDNGATYTVSEPSSFKLLSNSTTISDKFTASIQTPYNATNMKLIAYVAETANSAWVVETIVAVSPSNYVYGTPITDWQSYTPTLTNFGNATISRAQWSKNGQNTDVEIKIVIGSTTPTGVLKVSIPPGKIPSPNSTGFIVNSSAKAVINSSGATYQGAVRYDATNGVFDFLGGNGQQLWNATAPITWVAGDELTIFASYSTLGQSSSVQVSDGYEGRVVAAKVTNATASLTSSPSKVTFSTVAFDDVGGYSGGTYTVRSAGRYKVTASILIARSATVAGNSMQLAIYKNGAISTATLLRDQSNENQSKTITVTDTIDMVAGQTIEILGAAEGTSPTIPSDANRNYLLIEKLSGYPTISATETVGALYTGAPPTGTLGAAFNTVTFGTKVSDTHGAYSAGVYKVPVSGFYDISATILVINTSQAVGSITAISVYVDSVNRFSNQIPAQTTTALQFNPSINVKSVYLTAGQSVEIKSYSNATSPAFSTADNYNFFSISRVK